MFYESIRIKSTICGKDPFIVTEHFLLNDLYFESWNLELFLFLLVYHEPSHFTPFERIWSISCLFPSILRKSKTTSHGETLAKKTSSTLLQLTTPAATLTSVGDWQPLEKKKRNQKFLASFQAPELLGSVSSLPLESQNHSR